MSYCSQLSLGALALALLFVSAFFHYSPSRTTHFSRNIFPHRFQRAFRLFSAGGNSGGATTSVEVPEIAPCFDIKKWHNLPQPEKNVSKNKLSATRTCKKSCEHAILAVFQSMAFGRKDIAVATLLPPNPCNELFAKLARFSGSFIDESSKRGPREAVTGQADSKLQQSQLNRSNVLWSTRG